MKNKEVKLVIMQAIKTLVTQNRLKQREIAKIFGTQQPRVSDLLKLKTERFTIDILLEYLNVLGYEMNIDFSENLKDNRSIKFKTSIIKNKKSIYSLLK